MDAVLKNKSSDWIPLKNGPTMSGVMDALGKTVAQIKSANFGGVNKPLEASEPHLSCETSQHLPIESHNKSRQLSECLDELHNYPTSQTLIHCDLARSNVSNATSADTNPALGPAAHFMQIYVDSLFNSECILSPELKAQFGQFIQEEPGRAAFARFVDSKRGRHKNVAEMTFYSLIQHFALALFECHVAEDFAAAKSVMNMCFTFGYDNGVQGISYFMSTSEFRTESFTNSSRRPVQYPYMHLRGQALFKNARFWNAAFFQTVQESQKEHMANGRNGEAGWRENITFGVLGAFMCNMHALGLRKDFCMDFLYKQSNISSLPFDETRELLDYVDNLYAEAL